MFEFSIWFCFVIAKWWKEFYNSDTQIVYQFGCIDSAGETPSYISNLEVKSCCGEGSARVAVCENSKMHPLYLKSQRFTLAFFLPIIRASYDKSF